STNSLAHQISQQSPVNEGTLVITDHQTAGKGQRGNIWEAEPGRNLTFSLILKPGFLPVSKQFFLNIVICLALKDYLKEHTPHSIYIQWPNDILVHQKKISGVLIENQVQGSAIAYAIAGVGLNINQDDFSVASATSLSLITGKVHALDDALPPLLGFIERRYLHLRAGHESLLIEQYLAALYRRHEKHSFSSNGNTFEGIIEDLEADGRLRVRVGDEVR